VWPDHHVVVVLGFDEVVDRDVQRACDRGELVQSDAAVAGLDPAQRGGAEVAAAGQVVQRPPTCGPQAADALPDQADQRRKPPTGQCEPKSLVVGVVETDDPGMDKVQVVPGANAPDSTAGHSLV